MHASTPTAAAAARFLLRLSTSNKHAAAAVTRAADGAVVASASTAEKGGEAVTSASPSGVSSATVEHHRAIGERLASRLAAAGVSEVAWVRRAGQRHHGRARAVMEGLAAGGVRLA